MPQGETIMAPATPQGTSAIAMVRTSGDLSLNIVKEALGGTIEPESRKATLAYYTDIYGKCVDQVIYTYYPVESSYTGEPLLEIACHGNPLIIQKIGEDLIKRGCRMAIGGEFTRTAFLNGKMGLDQAEAVCDLITAHNEFALEAAQKQLAGAFGLKVKEYTDTLMQIIAEVEAYIDFPEDDLPGERVEVMIVRMDELVSYFNELIETQRSKNWIQNGLSTAIIGAPNAGKSSLLNALMGEERALVSPEPGTTRDFISEHIAIGPFSIRIMDTAGLRDEAEAIEWMGIKKSIEKIKEADFHIIVVDSSTERPRFPEEILNCLKKEQCLIFENKIDLKSSFEEASFLPGFSRHAISLKTKEGLNELKELWVTLFLSKMIKVSEDGLVVNARHAAALSLAKNYLFLAKKALRENKPAEIVASELRFALRALQEIVGEVDNEEILNKLFNTFCIGK